MLRGLLASSSLAAVTLLAAGGCAHPSPTRAPSSPEVGGPIFAFHVDLWPSLAGVTLAPSTGLTVDEVVARKNALGYEARFDSASGFDDDLERARRFLVASGSAEPLASVLGPSCVPYAERPEQWLFAGTEAAPRTLAVLVHAWQPYLDGKVTLEAAVDACVAEIGKAAT